MRAHGQTGRRLAALLTPALLAWAAGRAWLGHAELRSHAPVRGLFRAYLPPHVEIGGDEALSLTVIDPRPGDLLTEIRDRYRPGAPLPDPPRADTPEAWASALVALGLPAKPTTEPWNGADPRLYLGPAGPWLLTGVFGRQPVFFDPARGVVLSPTDLPPAPTLQLTGVREAPW